MHAKPSARRRWRGLLAIALAFAIGLAVNLDRSLGEVEVYALAGERMGAGAEVYRDEVRGFTYPPLAAVPWVPLAALSADWARKAAWYVLNFAALAGVLAAVARLLAPTLRRAREAGARTWVFWTLVASISGRHVLSVFENQSNDMPVLLALALAALAAGRGRESAAGALLGVGAAFKATPLLFAPVLLFQRRWRALGAMLAALAAGLFLPDLLFPREDGGSWTLTWVETFLVGLRPGDPVGGGGAWDVWNVLNQNLSGTLYRLTVVGEGAHTWDVALVELGDTPRRVLVLAAQLAVLAGVLWTVRRRRGEAEPADPGLRALGEIGAVACGMLLLSPMSSKQHFAVLLLPVAFALAHARHVRRDPLALAALAGMFVLGTLTSKGLIGRDLGNEILARGSVCACALLALAASARALGRRRATRTSPAADGAGVPVLSPRSAEAGRTSTSARGG